MPSLSDMPVELLIDNILPEVAVPDLLRLSSTSRLFANLGSDQTFWKKKLQEDFNFSNAKLFSKAATLKFIYRGLSKPQVFVWGERSHGRLGVPYGPRHSRDVSIPTRLRMAGVRVVSLSAGGMSFHALDSEGRVHVWGTLDGTSFALQSDGFSESGKMAETPMTLRLPFKTRAISCGRLHSSTLDNRNRVYTFLSWGRPFRLLSPTVEASTPETTPIQIECGWTYSAVLTATGDILVWWPFGTDMQAEITARNEEMDSQGNNQARASEDGVIPCVQWDLPFDPLRLRPIPELQPLSPADEDEGTKVIQIAAFDNNIIALTNKGHVLKMGLSDSPERASDAHWVYLPEFSEVEKVRQNDAFTNDASTLPPVNLHVSHISAHFQTFVAYSSGTILIGNTETSGHSKPQILPSLQNKSIISVVLGDYHNAALTDNGKLYTWGGYSAGALGLGDPLLLPVGTPGAYANNRDRVMAIEGRHVTPPTVELPTEVRFDHGRKKPKERFCFAATAAGWHTGALVVDLEPDESDEEEDEKVQEDEEVADAERREFAAAGLPQPPYSTHNPGQLPILPLRANRGVHFRVGYAGRSAGRGTIRVGFAGRGLSRGGSPAGAAE